MARDEAVAEKLDVETLKLAIPPIKVDPTTRYYIGVIKSSPLDMASAGGMMFHKHIDPTKQKRNSPDTYKDRKAGQVVELTDKQIELIKKKIIERVVRFRSTEVVVISSNKEAKYTRYPTDEPLAKHLYMVKLPGNAKPDSDWTSPDDGASPDALAK